MTREDLEAILKAAYPAAAMPDGSTRDRVAYSFFDPALVVAPPFVCYYFDSSRDWIADNKNYHKMSGWIVELYTERDQLWEEQQRIEEVLLANFTPYAKFEAWIESERMFQTMYTFTMIGG